MKRRNNQIWAQKYGIHIEAVINLVHTNQYVKINGRRPWIVVAQWRNPNNAKLHEFTSNNYWFDISDYVHVGMTISVKIDLKNPERYWMGLDDLLPKSA